MSRRKIKSQVKKPKKPKMQPLSIKSMMDSKLNINRAIVKEEDNADVVSLITEKKLDLSKGDDYKYMAKIAKEMNWSVSRLFKAADRVKQLLKEEEEAKEKSNE